MRYPRTPFMKRTFNLIEEKLPGLVLIPYIMQMVEPPNTWLMYNNARVNNQANVAGDPFSVVNYVTDETLLTPDGVHQRVAQEIKQFRDLFRVEGRSIADSMAILFDFTNAFSMRSWLLQANMDPRQIHWCETLDKSTGWYDRALTESKQLDALRKFLVLTWGCYSCY
jgi:hypothetical protein